MATMNNVVFAILKDKTTGLETDCYRTGANVIKKWTGTTCEEDALADMVEIYGSDEFRLVKDIAFVITGTITSD